MDDLIKEKEVLATEVWKLRKSLAEATSAVTPVSTPSADSGYNDVHEMNGLDNYDPQNPHALRRKIGECWYHLSDGIGSVWSHVSLMTMLWSPLTSFLLRYGHKRVFFVRVHPRKT